MNYYRAMMFSLNVEDNKGKTESFPSYFKCLTSLIAIPEENKIINKPALFVASKRDYVCSAELGKMSMRQWVPHAEIVEMDCGHWTLLEESERLNQTLERWLGNLPSPNKAQL